MQADLIHEAFKADLTQVKEKLSLARGELARQITKYQIVDRQKSLLES